MADHHSQEENTKLKQQIKFLTDLIDHARKQGPKHHEKSLPFRARPSKTAHSTMPTYAIKKGQQNTYGNGPHTSHFQKHKQIDKTKYSFVRTSEAQVVTSASNKGHTVTSHTPTNFQPNVVRISSDRIKMLKNDSVSSQKTQVPAGKVDLNSHSLSSLKKMLAAKMEAKALRNATKAVKQSALSRRKTMHQHLSNGSQSATNCDLRKQQDDFDNKFTQSPLDKSTPSSSNVPIGLIVPKQSNDLSRDSNKWSASKKVQHVQCNPRTSEDATQILEISKESPNPSIGSSKMSAGPSQISSGTSSASKDPSKDLHIPVPLPSKDDLAKGLKSTEAKIKELTVELTKLKEVAKIVNSSPKKVTPKPSKMIITSASGHHLHNSSSNLKYTNRKHFHSTTQHAARYVVSKYKLNKVHVKAPGHSKFKSNVKTSLFRKSSNLLHSKKPITKHGLSTYKWTRQVKNTPFLLTKWDIKPYTRISGNQHGKKTVTAWMPYWKRQLLLHGTSSNRRNVWQKDDRGRLSSSHFYVKGNPYASRHRMISTSHKGFTNPKTITVRGVKFQIGTAGKTLQRVDNKGNLSSDSLPRKSISRVDYRGITYKETRPGTLEKSSSYQTRIRANQALLKSIAMSTRRHKAKKSGRQYCMFYCRFGKCKRGENCTFIHDPDKVAVCTRFLRGTCHLSNCPFSHKISKEKMPVCSYFLKGGCVKEDCPYSHVNVNKDAKICDDFLRGFCPRGEKCKEKHILECPEFARTGQCPEGKKCKLMHRKKPVERRISASQKVKKRDVTMVETTKVHLDEGSSSQHTGRLINEQTKETIPFKMMKLPAFISIVSSDSDLTSPQDTDKPPFQKPQEQLRIKPRI